MPTFGIGTWRRRRADAKQLVKECEAFVNGEFAETCQADGGHVPRWAWINLLAHGTADDLRREARTPVAGDEWHRTRSVVAAAVIARVDAGGVSLAELQRTVLVPLELHAISTPLSALWSPRQLLVRVLAALPDKRRA